MQDISPFLLSLLSQPGLIGYEEPVSALIAEKWRPLVDELTTSRLGSLHGLRKAVAGKKSPCLMITAHMDAIGLMVKEVDQGLLRVTNIGGLDPRIFPGQMVTVHGKKEIPGVVQLMPDRLLKESESGKPPTFDRLFIDTGLDEKELKRLVKPGDLASFAQVPFQMEGDFLTGHSLDNRASVAALTVCLEEIRNFNLAWDVQAVATTQEELSHGGAATSTFEINPDLAIVVDVTFAKGPGASDYRTFSLAEGPTIGTGANCHPALVKKLSSVAEEMDMPFSMEAMPVSSGTEGMNVQITASGIPTVVLSIPIRYMHTSVEMAAMKDIYRTGRLLARWITSLEADSLNTLFEEEK